MLCNGSVEILLDVYEFIFAQKYRNLGADVIYPINSRRSSY